MKNAPGKVVRARRRVRIVVLIVLGVILVCVSVFRSKQRSELVTLKMHDPLSFHITRTVEVERKSTLPVLPSSDVLPESPWLSKAAFYPDNKKDIERPKYDCDFPNFKRVYDNIPDTELHYIHDHPALPGASEPCNRKYVMKIIWNKSYFSQKLHNRGDENVTPPSILTILVSFASSPPLSGSLTRRVKLSLGVFLHSTIAKAITNSRSNTPHRIPSLLGDHSTNLSRTRCRKKTV